MRVAPPFSLDTLIAHGKRVAAQMLQTMGMVQPAMLGVSLRGNMVVAVKLSWELTTSYQAEQQSKIRRHFKKRGVDRFVLIVGCRPGHIVGLAHELKQPAIVLAARSPTGARLVIQPAYADDLLFTQPPIHIGDELPDWPLVNVIHTVH